jgi:gliding motility-associated-like protein
VFYRTTNPFNFNTLKKALLAFVFVSLIFSSAQAQLIINEVSQGPSGSKEYVELLVVGTPTCSSIPCVDIRGYYIDDNNGVYASGAGTGIAQGCVRFKNTAFWSCIPIGTLIVIYNDSDANSSLPSDDLTMSDGNCRLIIPASNCTLLESNTDEPSLSSSAYPTSSFVTCGDWSTLAMANSDDSFQTRDASGNSIFSVSWGNNSTNSSIYFSGTSSTMVAYMSNADDNNPNTQSNWTRTSASGNETPGAPNNTANATWIASMNNGCSPLTPLTLTTTANDATCSCDGSITVVATGGIAPYSYSWSPSGGTGATASSLCAGTYTVTVTGANGCSATATETIASTGSLSITVNSETVCAGQSATLTATGADDYVWSTGATTDNISESPSANTTYTVTGTSGNCTATATGTITIASALSISVNSETICAGQSATLTATGADDYVWSTGATTDDITESPSADETYTVTGTSNGCTGTATATITVGSSLNISVNSETICAGQSATLTATGADDYVWSTGATTDGITESPSADETYTVTGTSNGCSGTATATITVGSSLNITVNSETICAGQSATLTATGADDYVWSTGATTDDITESPSADETYTVTGTSNGCSGTATATITVGSSLSITVNSETICAGQSATLTATGADDYVWSTGATTDNITESPSADETYTVIGTSNGCLGTATATITVGSSLSITVNSETICAGQSATLTATGADNYVWSTGATTDGITESPSADENYTVTGTSNGCSGTATATITITASPEVTFTADKVSDCEPFCVSFNSSSSNTIITWNWNFGDGQSSDIATPQHCYNNVGTHTVSLSATMDNGCITTVLYPNFITLEPKPFADFLIPLPISSIDAEVVFTNTSTDAELWNWDFGDTLNPDSNTSDITNPAHSYTDAGTYCVTLIASNNSGCKDTSLQCFEIDPEFTFYIPNAFTPNNDGKNDEFYGAGSSIMEYELSIHDRWGKEVFHTTNIEEKWDGKMNKGNREVCQQDTYVYIFTVRDKNKETHQYTGSVSLIR